MVVKHIKKHLSFLYIDDLMNYICIIAKWI